MNRLLTCLLCALLLLVFLLSTTALAQTTEKTSRASYNRLDPTYYDVSFRCADIQKVRDDMVATGVPFLCESYGYARLGAARPSLRPS